MGEFRFDAAFPISAKREETELSIKLSGIRHSGQSEKRMPEGKTERKNRKQHIGIVGTEARIN